jgi:glutamyl-tRNA reductase
MSLIVLGISHRSAPLPAREQVVYSPEQALEALRLLKSRHNVPQAMLLSTCNRTELYALVGSAEQALPDLKRALFLERLGAHNGAGSMIYERADAEAVKHLFRVACGLDSMVLGEHEILGQFRNAFELSRTAETVGTVFDRLASRAFHLGKRARTETGIAAGAVSLAYAAVELAEKIFDSLEGRGVLLLGAGEHGRLCAEHLLSRKVSPLLIANRTPAKAEELAARMGGATLPLERIAEAFDQVDIVVSTTGAQTPIIGHEMLRGALRHRAGGRSLVLLDVAVPRDIDPGVDRLRNVFRFDIDALQEIPEPALRADPRARGRAQRQALHRAGPRAARGVHEQSRAQAVDGPDTEDQALPYG